MKKLFVLFTIALTPLFSSNYTHFTLEPEYAPPINGYMSLPKDKESYPILIAVQSSQVESIVPYLNHFKDTCDHLGIAMVGIEKQGIFGPEDMDEHEYHQANFREKRMADHILLLEKIRDGLVPGWNGEVLFLGGSEGGMIAFQLASFTPETRAAMIFSAGGGLPPRKEVLLGAENYLKSMGTPSIGISMILSNFDRQMDEMIRNPTPEKFYYDYSYKWWASHLQAPSTLDAALSLECPILYVHGIDDEIIPIQSADKLVETFHNSGKNNITYLRLEGITHYVFRHDVEALKEYTYYWIRDLLSEPSALIH